VRRQYSLAVGFSLWCIFCVALIARNWPTTWAGPWLRGSLHPNGSSGGQAAMSSIVRASWAGPPALGLTAVLNRKRIGEASCAEVGLRVYAFTFGP